MIVKDYIKRHKGTSTLGWLKEKNWESSGLLEGLVGVPLETVVKLFNEVDFVSFDVVDYLFPEASAICGFCFEFIVDMERLF